MHRCWLPVAQRSPCFFDGSGHLRCLASDASENSTSDAPEIGKSGFSDFRTSGFSEIRKSGNLKIRIFGFPAIRIFGNRISEIPENLKIRFFRSSDFPFFREIGKSRNPVKKASDVEFAYVEFPLKKHGDRPVGSIRFVLHFHCSRMVLVVGRVRHGFVTPWRFRTLECLPVKSNEDAVFTDVHEFW